MFVCLFQEHLTQLHTACLEEESKQTQKHSTVEEKEDKTVAEDDSSADKTAEEDLSKVDHLRRILHLTGVWLDYNSGSMVNNPDKLAKVSHSFY